MKTLAPGAYTFVVAPKAPPSSSSPADGGDAHPIPVKLDVHSRAEAVSLAYQYGLVEPEAAAHSLFVEKLVTAE